VAIVPDVDGDRLADGVVGSGAGCASVRTSPGLERALELFGPPSPCDGRSTCALAAGGDADGAGRADVLVSRIDCGVALFSGRTRDPLLLIDRYANPSRVDLSAAGSCVDWIGDVDLDGCDDFVVAANESDAILEP